MGDEGHDFDTIWNDVSSTLWQAIFAYAGGRRDVADEAVAEALARAIERNGQVRDPKAYLFRVAFRVASAELRRDRAREVARLMGTSVAVVRVHLMRGRRRLADLLGENDDGD